jgi:hypothetical protein
MYEILFSIFYYAYFGNPTTLADPENGIEKSTVVELLSADIIISNGKIFSSLPSTRIKISNATGFPKLCTIYHELEGLSCMKLLTVTPVCN